MCRDSFERRNQGLAQTFLLCSFVAGWESQAVDRWLVDSLGHLRLDISLATGCTLIDFVLTRSLTVLVGSSSRRLCSA